MKIHPSSSTQRSHLFQFPTDIPLVTPPYSRYRGFIRPMTLVPPVFLTPKKDTSQLSQNSSLLLAEPKKHVDDREADVQPLSTPCYPQSSQTFEAEVSPVTLTEVSPSLLASTPEISTTPVRASSSERLKSPSSLALAEASPPKKVIKLTERPRNHSTPIENGTLKLSKKLTQATITQCFHALGLPKSGDARKKRECSGSHLNDLKQVQTGSVFQESVNTNLNSSYDRVPKKQSNEPNFKFKDVVRKKDERCKLSGYDCVCCKNYLKSVAESTGSDIVEVKKKLSRHRGKHIPPKTPEHFWNLSFPKTPEKFPEDK